MKACQKSIEITERRGAKDDAEQREANCKYSRFFTDEAMVSSYIALNSV